MIRVTNQLTEQERKVAKALIASRQAHDQTFREPYLSNMLNFDPIMPAFFLYYQEGKLLGLLTVYADNEDVEVSFLVNYLVIVVMVLRVRCIEALKKKWHLTLFAQ